jgi:hypothetical protein
MGKAKMVRIVREDHTIQTVQITETTKEEPTEDKTIGVVIIAKVREVMTVETMEVTIVQDHNTIGMEVIIAVLMGTMIVLIVRMTMRQALIMKMIA